MLQSIGLQSRLRFGDEIAIRWQSTLQLSPQIDFEGLDFSLQELLTTSLLTSFFDVQARLVLQSIGLQSGIALKNVRLQSGLQLRTQSPLQIAIQQTNELRLRRALNDKFVYTNCSTTNGSDATTRFDSEFCINCVQR